MGSLKVNITCGGENMVVQQLQIEPDNWHHRFEISVATRMVNHKNVISIEMNEVTKPDIENQFPSLKKDNPTLPPKTLEKPETAIQRVQPESSAEKETTDTIDGSVWL